MRKALKLDQKKMLTRNHKSLVCKCDSILFQLLPAIPIDVRILLKHSLERNKTHSQHANDIRANMNSQHITK